VALVYGQDERVTAWVAAQAGNFDPTPACAAIGVEHNGKLVAGIYFDGRTQTNVFAHIASVGQVLPAVLLWAVGRYAYEQLGVKRMTFSVAASNAECLALVRGMGAEHEATLREGREDGDVFLFVLWRDCALYKRLKAAFERA